MRTMLRLYELFAAIVFLVALPFYAIARLLGGRPFGSIVQRLGFYGTVSSRHDVWIHAVSVGEVNAARIIADHLDEIDSSLRLLVTTTTVTGRSLAEQIFKDATIAWFPFDFTFSINRFCDRFRPAVHVAVETELWPVLAYTLDARGIPLLLANARVSDRSFPRYHRLRFLTRRVLPLFDSILARETTDRDRLEALGAPASQITVTGNVKFDYEPDTRPLPVESQLEDFSRGGRAIIFASTAAGEEEMLQSVIDELVRRETPVIVAPRKQARFDEVAALLEERIGHLTRRSELDGPIEGSLLLLDTIGELSRVYRHCAAAFIGGSLVPHGGQNPIEACAVGCPVAFGPYTTNFRDITDELVRLDAARRVANSAELHEFLIEMIQDVEARESRSRKARLAVEENRGAAEAVAHRIVALARGGES